MSRRDVGRIVGALAVAAIMPACGSGISRSYVPFCPASSQNGTVLILMAQSVPSATSIPCVAALPAGWAFGGEDIRSGRSTFWLDSDRAGLRAVTITLTPSCEVTGAVLVPSGPGEAGLQRYERPTSLPPHYSASRYYRFPGGCVTYRFAFAQGSSFALALEATDALSFVSRSEGVALLDKQGFRLCGAGVTCRG